MKKKMISLAGMMVLVLGFTFLAGFKVHAWVDPLGTASTAEHGAIDNFVSTHPISTAVKPYYNQKAADLKKAANAYLQQKYQETITLRKKQIDQEYTKQLDAIKKYIDGKYKYFKAGN